MQLKKQLMETQEILKLKELEITLNPLKIIYNNKEIELKNKIVSNDAISFNFNDDNDDKDDKLILYRNQIGCLYQRNGERNDFT